MQVIPSKKEDLPIIMRIVSDAQAYLASLNIDQWQNGYPDENRILTDISLGGSYLITNENNEVVGTTFFTTDKDPTYSKIEGKWLTPDESKYGVIHRVAVFDKFRKIGFAKFVFDHFEEKLISQGIPSMRIDTHRDNLGMQKLLKNRGYEYCGVIYLLDGNERLAYEKVF